MNTLTTAERDILFHFLDDYRMILRRRMCNDIILTDTPGNHEVVKAARALWYADDRDEEDYEADIKPRLIRGFSEETGYRWNGIFAQDDQLLNFLISRLEEVLGTSELSPISEAADDTNGFMVFRIT